MSLFPLVRFIKKHINKINKRSLTKNVNITKNTHVQS